MQYRIIFVFVSLLFPLLIEAAPKTNPPVGATIETTLTGDGERIRQFAFDGDAKTYFASNKNVSASDHFTLVFDKPVAMKSIQVIAGRPDAGDKLETVNLQVSTDGKTFEECAKFVNGVAKSKLDGRKIQAVRIKPSRDIQYPLAIREIIPDSDPVVTVFKHPVEFIVDVKDAPEMKEWAEKAARICERQYDAINDELKDERFLPPHRVRMTLKKMNGVAYTSGGAITGSVEYFKRHGDDFGAMVHETVHVVQSYRLPGNPGWLVEGIADYVRFFKYEPGKLGRLDPKRARYDGSYRVTAAFLAYLTEKYDKAIVRKLNNMMREGEYKKEVFQRLTGKTLEQLGDEWRATLEG